jgi:hypothetical protein
MSNPNHAEGKADSPGYIHQFVIGQTRVATQGTRPEITRHTMYREHGEQDGLSVYVIAKSEDSCNR